MSRPPRLPDIPRLDIGLRTVVIGAGLLVLLWAAFSSAYMVPAESVGVVQRFGRALQDTVSPGLQFKLPFGIDRVAIVPIQRQMKQEFGFQSNPYADDEPDGLRSESWVSSKMRRGISYNPETQRSMVTGDLNAVLVDWVVQYRIDEPQKYLFHVNEPVRTLRDLSEAVMREVIGDRTVDEVITIGRQEIEVKAREQLASLVKGYELGVTIDQVQLKDIDPPEPVQDSFDEVNKAQQDREQMINQASGEYNRVVPRAKGLADQRIREAEGYQLKRVNEAQGDVAAFNAQLEQYLKAPEVTRLRLYFETMAAVLPQAGPKIIVDDAVKQVYPFINGGNPSSRPSPVVAPAANAYPTSTSPSR